jgi:hypothetical protein
MRKSMVAIIAGTAIATLLLPPDLASARGGGFGGGFRGGGFSGVGFRGAAIGGFGGVGFRSAAIG